MSSQFSNMNFPPHTQRKLFSQAYLFQNLPCCFSIKTVMRTTRKIPNITLLFPPYIRFALQLLMHEFGLQIQSILRIAIKRLHYYFKTRFPQYEPVDRHFLVCPKIFSSQNIRWRFRLSIEIARDSTILKEDYLTNKKEPWLEWMSDQVPKIL